MKRKGLFINNAKAQDSIYESGLMVFNCLSLSDAYQLDYVEIDKANRSIPLGYDFYFFNYHAGTLGWLDTSKIKKIPGFTITMVLEILPGDPFVMCPDNHFDAYCVIDPTIRLRNPRVFAFPRPLEKVSGLPPYVEKEIPVIGTFGFATRGKGFQHVVEAVNREFERAVVKINIPFGNFVQESEAYSEFLEKICREKAKKGIEVLVTHDYMSKEQLIEWCSQNTLNCFLYDRNMPGLAATTDQAIVSGRPLAVSRNDTFRHILLYLPPYPEWSLKESIARSGTGVRQMQDDWAPLNFARKFEELLTRSLPARAGSTLNSGHMELPEWKHTFVEKLQKRYRKYKRLISKPKLKKFITSAFRSQHEELI